MKSSGILVLAALCTVFFSVTFEESFAEDVSDLPQQLKEANSFFYKGEYREAVNQYDEILDKTPNNIETLIMKGTALSNLGRDTADMNYHKSSLLEFYKASQIQPNNVIVLNGMGVGFGNLGEYQESASYFEKALSIEPANAISKNYLDYAKKSLTKYPYTPTEKPKYLEESEKQIITEIPKWVKSNAEWWASGNISDDDFLRGIEFLIKNEIIKVEFDEQENKKSDSIPKWVKSNAEWWASGNISDDEFTNAIQYLIKNGMINVKINQQNQISQEDIDRKNWNFNFYLNKIVNDVSKQKRYIEYANPSFDVKKKFLRDAEKWNYEQAIKSPNLPKPQYVLIDDVYHLKFKIFVNDQPPHLPIDHSITLQEGLDYWSKQVFTASDGKKLVMDFVHTNTKSDANILVTWVARDLGEGVLGHANLGPGGIVEVALLGKGCDGSYQLFGINTVETIMIHELGHVIGLKHSENKKSIMYPSIKKTEYAYCLLN